MAVALGKYLMQQGYEAEKITILVCYGQQLFAMRDAYKQQGFTDA